MKKIKKKIVRKKKNIIDRHKRVLDNLGKSRKLNRALEKEGYSPSYILSGQFKKTDSWKNLLSEHLPDNLLAEKHKQLLEKKETVIKNNIKTGEIETIPTGEIDVQAVKSGLDMAYKLKSRYGEQIIRHKFGNLSDEDVEREIAREISEGVGTEEGANQEKNE